jgi:antitoxin VapB
MGAQMNIKNGEAVELARAIASHTGETLTDAVTIALRERLANLTREIEIERKMAAVREIQADFAEDMRRAGVTAADLWKEMEDMYDEDGLPI